jgi:hypothetical protein
MTGHRIFERVNRDTILAQGWTTLAPWLAAISRHWQALPAPSPSYGLTRHSRGDVLSAVRLINAGVSEKTNTCHSASLGVTPSKAAQQFRFFVSVFLLG